MSTVLDVITDALAEIGQVGIGQSVSAEQAQQALRVANRMMQKFSIQRLLLPTASTRVFLLSANVQDYTVGPSGATFTGARPLFVEAGLAVTPGTVMEDPMNILDKTKWGAIRDKGATCSPNGKPSDLWPEYTYPNLAFHVWPIPATALTVKLGTWEALQTFLTVADVLNLPFGYEEVIVQNLAFELASYYDMPINQALAQLGVDALNNLKALNAQGIPGAFGESRTLQNPNLDIPAPSGPPPGQGQ